MNVAIIGSSGYISGFLLKRYMQERGIGQVVKIDRVIAPDILYFDLLQPHNFDYTRLDNIDYVVFTAAVSGPDQCANQFDICWNINVVGTQYFITQALKHHCRVLFLSSDAVFGDIPGMIYTEDSQTQPNTAYGKMKQAIENAFQYEENFKAIRLSYVVSAKDRFVSYCLKCIQENKKADIFHPFYRNCISISDVVDTVIWVGRHWNEYPHNFLNVTGSELVSRIRIADEINRITGDRLVYTITRPNESFYRNRPAITQMMSKYLTQCGIVKQECFTTMIQKELEGII